MVEKAETSVARELVDRILTGDEEAEGELVCRYGASVMRMLQALTKNRWTAEDIHQETFTIVLRRLRRRPLDNPEALGQFLRQTARKVVMAANRKRRLRQQTEIEGAEIEEIIDPQPGQLVYVLRKEEEEIVRRTIADIRPLRYRQLLLRFYLEEEAKEIICAELGLSAVHFNRVLFRARRRFLRAVEGQEMRRSVARRQ